MALRARVHHGEVTQLLREGDNPSAGQTHQGKASGVGYTTLGWEQRGKQGRSRWTHLNPLPMLTRSTITRSSVARLFNAVCMSAALMSQGRSGVVSPCVAPHKHPDSPLSAQVE